MHQRIMLLVLSLALLVAVLPVQAQDGQPLVIFIEDVSRLRAASSLDNGPDGLTDLVAMFQGYGARTAYADLSEPLPVDADVVVLVRPLAALSVDKVARLWVHMARGGNLLLAIDPAGPSTYRGEGAVRANPDRSNGGLPILLRLVYGIDLQDAMVIEPWFTPNIIVDNTLSHMLSEGEDFVRHPVAAPLVDFGLPVQMWAARTMAVDPIGSHSWAAPLLLTRSAYGETDRKVFTGEEPLVAHIGIDEMGILLTGALAENTFTGSRVVVLGDAEMLENGYGLTIDTTTNQPMYLGNMIFAQRVVGWLMDAPEETWPTLPVQYTSIAVNGDPVDWMAIQPTMTDALGDAQTSGLELLSVRALRDDAYLYIMTELLEPPRPDTRLIVRVDSTGDGIMDASIYINANAAQVLRSGQDLVVIADSDIAAAQVIEVRLPLSVVGANALIGEICIADGASLLVEPPGDCVGQALTPAQVANTIAPRQVAGNGPRAIVSYNSPTVNIRSAPDLNAALVDRVPNGTVYMVLGRDEAGEWLQVQNSEYTAWMASFLVNLNTDVEQLPVVASGP